MPTADRRLFVPRAIEYFLRQDYPKRELLIVDDGKDPVADLVPDDPRIRYLRLDGRQSLGAKRNLACREAAGEVLMHWDDDDWHAPSRISVQVDELRRTGAELCGLDRLLFFDPTTERAWRYKYPRRARKWLAGGTFCYTRELQRRHPFPRVDVGEDNRFAWSVPDGSMVALDDPSIYVALVHPGNTSRKRCAGSRWRPRPVDEVRALLGDDAAFYELLAAEKNSKTQGPQPVSGPLVSCVMATGGRRHFVPQAIRCFQRQTYPLRELIVVDDGVDRCDDLLPDDDRIHYLRLPEKTNLGRKLNLGIERASGSVIQKLDDDDYYHPDFLATMVAALPKDPSDRAIAALDRFVVLLTATGELRDSGAGWSAGPTLCFHRTVWEHRPFRDAPRAVDQAFLKDAGARRIKVSRPELLILVRHGGNHLWRRMGGRQVDDYFRRRPAYRRPLRELVPEAELRFYESLRDPSRASPKRQSNSRDQASNHMPSTSTPTSRPPVSACLLSWKRPQNLPTIVEHLQRHDFIDEILVWNNDPDSELDLGGDNVRVIDAPENLYCYGRFLCVREARNAIVYVQDDDWLVDNVEALYTSFLSDDSTLTHGLSSYHLRKRDRYRYAHNDLALLGWGAVFYRDWVSVLDTDGIGKPDRESNGADPLFLREADKFFTLLLKKPHRTLPARLRRLRDEGSVDIAMHRESQHEKLKALAIRRALAASRRTRSVEFPVTWHVVITCHNYGKYLETAVESVLRNDADYELTIVDDGSTDDSRQIGEAYASEHRHVAYLRIDESVGVTRARNRGVSRIDSLFVVSLDADDKIGPDYLFEAEQLLRSGCDVANPDAILFGRVNERWQVPDDVSSEMLLERNHVHCCAAFRRSYWVQVGGMDEEMTSWSDYEFWIRLARAGARIRRLPGDHFFYRKHGTSISTRSHQRREELQEFIWRRHGRPRKRRARSRRR